MENKAGIIFATKTECAPFIKQLHLKMIEKHPFAIYAGDSIVLIISGIGKSNTAMATTYLIVKFKLSQFFNLGACGAVSEQYNTGDIIHINKIIEYDCPLIIRPGLRTIKPPVIGKYQHATLATQDRPVITREDRKKVATVADLVDMEGAAFARVCRTFHVNGYLFKIVTDTPQKSGHHNIIHNIIKTRYSLFIFFIDNILK